VDGTTRELTSAAVSRIRQRLSDRLWNRALIGFGAGAALGAYAAGSSDSCSYEGGAQCYGPALTMAALGAGIGTGIDALIKGRKVIYEAPAAKSVAWMLAPVISHRMAAGRPNGRLLRA
jgi:hypothetical protein